MGKISENCFPQFGISQLESFCLLFLYGTIKSNIFLGAQHDPSLKSVQSFKVAKGNIFKFEPFPSY